LGVPQEFLKDIFAIESKMIYEQKIFIKIYYKMKKLIALLLCLNLCLVSFGAYIKNLPVQLIQPNGEVLHLLVTGDEFYRTIHDSEGYSIIRGDDGWYYYALYNAEIDELAPSEYRVIASRNFVLPVEKGLRISHEKYMEIRRAYYEPIGREPSGISKHSILKDLANRNAKTTHQINNIVICIGFDDTEEMTNSFSHVDGMFNSNGNSNMQDYFLDMSYQRLDIPSHFYPPADGETLRFYKDPNPKGYYCTYNATTNPIGYATSTERTNREQALLANAIRWVNEYWPVSPELDLDVNNDGYCDFITFVVCGFENEWNELLWPHAWALYKEAVYINGKRVWDFNFETDVDAVYFCTGAFCHEGFHVLGAPDLYHYEYYTNLDPVNIWDLMGYPYLVPAISAYMKYRYGYGGWITNLPTATINKTYELFPMYEYDGSDSEKQVIYQIPMSDINTQYSVVEYRKTAAYDHIPNQGFLIYRVNSNFEGNGDFNGTNKFDELYLYRPGSSQTSGIYTQGNLNQAPFNSTNGRTAFNSATNPKPCQSNGTAEHEQNINNILYDSETDSYTFFYGDPENRNISISETQLLLEMPLGSTETVTITSNVLWRITIPETDTDWLSVSQTKGLNDGMVTFTALSDNTTEAPRLSNVTITGNGETFNVTVIQAEQTEQIMVEVAKTGNFKLYPNPVGDILNIVRATAGKARVEIFNSMGLMVKSFEINEIKNEINLSTLTSGVYFIKLSDNRNSSVQRFVKEKE
jgi:M6 family metalloprotease-like protein